MTNNSKPVVCSAALVIYNEDKSKYLIVKRPLDDASMPGYWGFPAASKKNPEEKWEDIARRAASTKLGVTVEIDELIGEDTSDRGDYILVMRDYAATIIKGEPNVPQTEKGITQYIKQRWSDRADELTQSAKEGSLCSRIFFRSKNISW